MACNDGEIQNLGNGARREKFLLSGDRRRNGIRDGEFNGRRAACRRCFDRTRTTTSDSHGVGEIGRALPDDSFDDLFDRTFSKLCRSRRKDRNGSDRNQSFEKFIGGKNLVIVPQKVLHYIPFNALYDGESYLIGSREIVFSPSATVWQILSEKQTIKSENALLIGFANEHIPNVVQEIEALQNVFKHSQTFTGEQATFAAFAENAEKFDVLHFACHGQFRAENPLFSSLHLADGFVTVRDTCSYDLNAELVCLSACETGLSSVADGEEILGLARGFLSAGASSLVLSLWNVNDEATTRLMKKFYKELQRGASISASLVKEKK